VIRIVCSATGRKTQRIVSGTARAPRRSPPDETIWSVRAI
jgi:hypothetical protein